MSDYKYATVAQLNFVTAALIACYSDMQRMISSILWLCWYVVGGVSIVRGVLGVLLTPGWDVLANIGIGAAAATVLIVGVGRILRPKALEALIESLGDGE